MARRKIDPIFEPIWKIFPHEYWLLCDNFMIFCRKTSTMEKFMWFICELRLIARVECIAFVWNKIQTACDIWGFLLLLPHCENQRDKTV